MRNDPAPLWAGDPASAWEPYDPKRDGPWDRARVAHLHRRAGFGATPIRLDRDLADGPGPAVDRMIVGDRVGPDGRTAAEFEAVARSMADSACHDPTLGRIRLAWLFRLLHSPDPLRERLTLAWHGHYATGGTKVDEPAAMLDQVEAIRAHADGPISALHRAMLDSAALQLFLDGTGSDRERPNENLGREFLELYALGEGNYSEADVKAAARALTGYRIGARDDFASKPVVFDARRHDDGPKALLGQVGPWGPADLVRIASARPAAACWIARRLFLTFVADDAPPPASLVEALADRMRTPGDVDVARGVRTILGSRLFFAESVRGRRVKSPVEFVVGLARTGGWLRPGPDAATLDVWLTRMGQTLLDPAGVAGWPGGLAWLGTAGLVARANGVAALTASPAAEARLRAAAEEQGFRSPAAWADALAAGFAPGGSAPTQIKPANFGEALRLVASTPAAQLA